MRKWFSSLWVMGIGTLIIFPLLAWPLMYWQDIEWIDLFHTKQETLYSIPNFLSAGILFGLSMIWLTELEYFEKALERYKNLLTGFKISKIQVIFLSTCAGFGEEIFFRGAMQPLIGIIGTAVIFVAIHGYYSAKNFKINLFALFLTLFIIFLGWGCREYSIWHAIAGHFSYDLVLLAYYRRTS